MSRSTYNGAPLLDGAPFAAWLAEKRMSRTEIATRLGCDEGRVRRLLARENPLVTEQLVERAGIALDGDPRLAARLYPELDW